MINAKKVKQSVKYANFHITNAVTKYTLHVNGFSGVLADALKYSNRQKFSTFDSDNDSSYTHHCALDYFGAWWFHGCFSTHLNGKYYSAGKMGISRNILVNSGIHWHSNGYYGDTDSLIFTEMKVRRKP